MHQPSVKYLNYYDGLKYLMVMNVTEKTAEWIVRLIQGLNEHVDEKTRKIILEQCGRQCQSPDLIKKVKGIYEKSGNTDDFLDKLSKVFKYLHKEGDNVYLIYPECYCEQVNKIPKGKLSEIYCNCSRGWIKALFGGAMGKPVEVIKEKSIVSGDDQCKFRVLL